MNKKGKKEAPAKEAVPTPATKDPKVKEVAKEPAKPAEPAEESNVERRAREEREELKRERKEHKHEAHLRAHEAHEGGAAGNVMDDLSKKQAYKKFAYRGLDITKLISLTPDEVAQNLRSRQRRRLRRKMPKAYATFIQRLLNAKKGCPVGEKPKTIKTHLRDCIVLPSMVQSMINVHNGKGYTAVEVKPEMIGYYLEEFSMSYKRVMHGKPGVGATHSSKFVPIK